MLTFNRIKWWFKRRTPAYKRQACDDRARRADFRWRQTWLNMEALPVPPIVTFPPQIQAAVDKANAYYAPKPRSPRRRPK